MHQLGNPGFTYDQRDRESSSCFYNLGENFLVNMFVSLGGDVTSAALRDIFLGIHAPDSQTVTSKVAYQAFQNNLRPGQESKFRDLFRRLHGGPLSEVYSNVPDDHGDGPSRATSVAKGKVVPGTFENPLDTDYFKFHVEAGQEFQLIFQHDFFNRYVGEDLYVKVHPLRDGPSVPLDPAELGLMGRDVYWKAQLSGDYFLSMESKTGMTGSYSLQVVPVDGD